MPRFKPGPKVRCLIGGIACVASFSWSALAAMPAIAQPLNAAGKPIDTNGNASIPDFTGTWTHPVFPWFEPPASGPGPITNLSRWAEQTTDGAGGPPALPSPPPRLIQYN